MQEINEKDLSIILESQYKQFIFLYTPFCGTCKVAGKMLETLENIENLPNFHTMNASLFPDFMQNYQIESVPCLAIIQEGHILDKTYAFHSVPFMYEKLLTYSADKG
ncbi:thioredoxin family protein [Virgibacillus sp. MSP4-1]|uniref:thioredoxin family protein n=1 Tax=Virgibacillus sp. MSP4-1 TaxID=2700081 RepID=UPI0003A6FCB0|nr:thioredoxin family protein [Virgibacillus sp. MSP4-1]QHS23151.1 thioredoxin family protein [Virgibacillus sp. MSP4-1]